jgi:sRNA-binding protein
MTDIKGAPAPVADKWHIKLWEPLRERLQSWPALLPSKPGDPIRPLAIGTDRALAALLVSPDDDGKKLIKTIVMRHCQSVQYATAMSRDGAMRHDLDGNPVEPVPDEHRQHRVTRTKASSAAPPQTAPQTEPDTTEEIMVAVKALKITAVLPPDQLKPSEASTVALTVAAPDGAKATAVLSGKTYRRALAQIAAIGADQAVVVLQGSMKKPGEIEGAGIAVTARKTD